MPQDFFFESPNEKKMAKPSKLYRLCSVLMTLLFSYSASVQFNDHDWYFWLPLYSCACVVNMVSWAISFRATIRRVARLSILLGLFLFIKVVTEDIVNGIAGFRSLDLSERVVREKTGSGLVVMCSILQLEASALPEGPSPSQRKGFPKFVDFGMAILVGFSYGLPIVFFVVQQGEMKF